MYTLDAERPQDAAAIEHLLDRAFGPGRLAKPSYQYRHDVAPVAGLSLVARCGGELVGSIRFWPVRTGARRLPALLLGPLGVAPQLQGRGIGRALVWAGLEKVRQRRLAAVFLVGDADYYVQFGFRPAAPFGVTMPHQPDRLMVLPLDPVWAGELAGAIAPGRGLRCGRAAVERFTLARNQAGPLPPPGHP